MPKKTESTKTIEALQVGESVVLNGSIYYPSYVHRFVAKKVKKFAIANKGCTMKDGVIECSWRITRTL